MKEARSLRINTSFINSLAQKSQLKEFAIFLHLKSLYSNSCILNYTQQSLSDKSGLPLSAIKKHIKLFIDRGWCKRHFSSLVFCKMKTIDTCKIKLVSQFIISGSVKQIFDDLCHQVLKIKQRQFDRFKQLRADLSNSQNSVIQRKANRIADKLNLRNSPFGASSMLRISISSISDLLGVSAGNASVILKRLKQRGVVQCVTANHSIVVAPGKAAKALLASVGTFYHKGKVHIIECNQYQF